MTELSIVFMGTPDFAVSSLRALLDAGYRVVAVVTQPDRPIGRKRELAPTPVKAEALKHGIPVLQPERVRHPEAIAEIAHYNPDLIVTAAYGQLVPKAILDMPRHGCINVHGSLLPKYRGGAPIQYAIMNGEPVTGVTLMYMAEGLDTGDMISKVEVPIGDDDTSGTMFDKLSVAGAELLVRTLPDLIADRIQPQPQNHAEATYSPTIKREQEQIDWGRSSLELFRLIRALNPRPGAYTTWNGDNFKIFASHKPKDTSTLPSIYCPGTVLQIEDSGIEVQTGAGTLWLTVVQPAGKKAMDVPSFRRGGQLQPGAVFGEIDATYHN